MTGCIAIDIMLGLVALVSIIFGGRWVIGKFITWLTTLSELEQAAILSATAFYDDWMNVRFKEHLI